METRVTVRADELPAGGMMKLEAEGVDVLVANVEGAYYAVEATCPHGHGNLWEGTLKGCILTCPAHGAMFDIRTGRLQKPKVNYYGLPYGGPATRDLKTYTVEVNNGEVSVVA